MPAAPLPPNEIRRLAAVQKVRLLGTPAEERFDKITRLARRMFDVPMAIIDIVGEKLAWLKSVQGFDRFEVLRDHSYCHYTVLNDEVCLITDARTDPRTFDNPYAKSFVFYAGVPIVFDDENVGVLCVASSEPRTMSSDQMDALKDLASLVEHELNVAALSEAQVNLAIANEELEMKAMVDVLTRVWNRGAIMEIAARELEGGRTRTTATGIILLDIDHFKKVNDTHGHQAGDEVLRRVSERLRMAVRPQDAVGRYGGEEFLLVIPDCGKEIVTIANRVREMIAEIPVTFEDKIIPVTVSMGATVSLEGAHFVDMLVKAADSALYKAKAGGRNKVEYRAMSPSLATLKKMSSRPPKQ